MKNVLSKGTSVRLEKSRKASLEGWGLDFSLRAGEVEKIESKDIEA